MIRERIVKGVLDVQTALSDLSEAEAAIVFSRVVEGFEDPDADAAVAVLGQKAEAVHTRLHLDAQRNILDLAEATKVRPIHYGAA